MSDGYVQLKAEKSARYQKDIATYLQEAMNRGIYTEVKPKRGNRAFIGEDRVVLEIVSVALGKHYTVVSKVDYDYLDMKNHKVGICACSNKNTGYRFKFRYKSLPRVIYGAILERKGQGHILMSELQIDHWLMDTGINLPDFLRLVDTITNNQNKYNPLVTYKNGKFYFNILNKDFCFTTELAALCALGHIKKNEQVAPYDILCDYRRYEKLFAEYYYGSLITAEELHSKQLVGLSQHPYLVASFNLFEECEARGLEVEFSTDSEGFLLDSTGYSETLAAFNKSETRYGIYNDREVLQLC